MKLPVLLLDTTECGLRSKEIEQEGPKKPNPYCILFSDNLKRVNSV